MTISNQTNRTSATGTNTVGQAVAFLFPIDATSDLVVMQRVTATGVETTLTEVTNYTVSIVADAGGTVTMVTAVAVTAEIHVYRDTPSTQSLDLVTGGTFNAENIETALDKGVKLGIENQDALTRTMRIPQTDATSINMELPPSPDRAGKYLTFDANGEPAVTVDKTTGTASVSAFGETLIDDATAAAAQTTLLLKDGSAHLDVSAILSANVFDVTHSDYGAVGNGTTDDATALQAAIDAAELVGGAVYLPPGKTYITGTQLTIDASMALLGIGAIIKQEDGANITNVLNIDLASTDDLYLRIKVDGNMDNNTAVNGIVIDGIQVGCANVQVGVMECDVGFIVQGNTESKIFTVDASNCTIGVQEQDAGGSTPDENTYFISGHANATHYKKNAAVGITSIVHLSCETSSAAAVIITSTDSKPTTLSGEIRGCADHGVHITQADAPVVFNNLIIDGDDSADEWGILVDAASKVTGEAVISNFDGGVWIKEISTGSSMCLHMSAMNGPLSGLQLGDTAGGNTTAQRFTLRPGSNILTPGTNGIWFDKALGCEAYTGFVSGGTNDILFDTGAANCTAIDNGRNITFSKYTDNGTDNKLVFTGESLATFVDTDTTPSVLGYSAFLSNTTGVTITRFDYGYPGQIISIISGGATVYDTTANARLLGSSVDITTAAGDTTTWMCKVSGTTSSVWYLLSWIDVSKDNSVTT